MTSDSGPLGILIVAAWFGSGKPCSGSEKISICDACGSVTQTSLVGANVAHIVRSRGQLGFCENLLRDGIDEVERLLIAISRENPAASDVSGGDSLAMTSAKADLR